MERYAMVTCPECNGRAHGMVHLHTTTGGRWEDQPCTFCDGAGYVRSHALEKWREGQALRAERLGRKMTLREEAKRLGITASELSRRESGRDA